MFLEQWKKLPNGEKGYSLGRGISPKDICP
jgi:hypothetical protein